MFRNFKATLLNPLFVFCMIAALECIPYGGERASVLNEMPLTGDNFKTQDDQTIYYYSGQGKYSYPSAACYFGFGNPSFETNYRDGGVKTIEKRIAESIPLLGTMCGAQRIKPIHTNKSSLAKQLLSTNYLLDNFSNISHFISYFLLSLSLLRYYKFHNKKYWVSFGLCFLGGGVLEFVQLLFVKGRTASFEDQLLNCIGALLGIVFVKFLNAKK